MCKLKSHPQLRLISTPVPKITSQSSATLHTALRSLVAGHKYLNTGAFLLYFPQAEKLS